MRKLFITVIFTLFAISLFAQNSNTDVNKNVNFGVDVFYDFWQNMPDSIGANGLSLGSSVYAMYEKQIWTEDGRYRLALGAGITTHKLSTNSYIDTLYKAPITFRPIGEDVDYKRSTLVVTYVDFMGELRYKSPSKFRLAVGMKVGFKLSNAIKYEGEHLTVSDGHITGNGIQENIKNKEISFIEKMRVGPTLKIGYGFFNLNVYYSFTKLFSEENGPELYPISVGITLNPF